ncbi:UNVERIFIED_CONTAM: hypothetical protein GTU68_046434 [Idotea baltica]|nr:hypothetical protein [Idotea baltica]
MIPAIAPYANDLWPKLLRTAYRDVDTLLERLQLQDQQLLVDRSNHFPLRVPEPFVARMRCGDPTDPLLRQVLPMLAEREVSPELCDDPLAEQAALATPGLLHKYQGRALVISTGACAVHCRYCFRRHFPYADNGPNQYQDLLDHVAKDPSIREVILSGGDPLALSDVALAELVGHFAALPHVTRVRLHSRLPVVLPQRVNDSLVSLLTELSVPVVMVIHANHANELDASTARAMAALKHPNITLLNQSVLLAGINNSTETLVALSEALFAQGVLPYYLHMTDAVQGTAEFIVTDAEAIALYRTITAELPGYLLPKLVREVPGERAKSPISV